MLKKKTFTLIEMLIVIAIIGILSTILLPALTIARESARRGTCLSNLKQIGFAMINYANEFNNFPRINTATNNFPDIFDLESGNALVTYGIPLAGPDILIWKCPSSRDFPVGINAGEIKLYGMDGTIGKPNYAIMTNWIEETEYNECHSPGLSPTNVSKDKTGPIVGDNINGWTGRKNYETPNKQINGPHCTSSGDAIGGHQVFSDGHGKWYNIGELASAPAWSGTDSSGKSKKYYWAEE